jgi:hypothetical protein
MTIFILRPFIIIFLSLIFPSNATAHLFGTYGGSIANTVFMEAIVYGRKVAWVEILIRLPKSTNLELEGWAWFKLKNAEYKVEKVDLFTQKVTFLPNGAESHPVAKQMTEIVNKVVDISFPMTGNFDPFRNCITYDFGPLELVLDTNFDSGLYQYIKAGDKLTIFDTPENYLPPGWV